MTAVFIAHMKNTDISAKMTAKTTFLLLLCVFVFFGFCFVLFWGVVGCGFSLGGGGGGGGGGGAGGASGALHHVNCTYSYCRID